MKVGFTGTRDGLTDLQLAWLYTTLETGHANGTITEIHHGACIGADAQVHGAALDIGIDIHVWPPVNPIYVATQCLYTHTKAVTVTRHAAMPYLVRDREIVRATTGLIGFPKQTEQPENRALWGGTWYTIDFGQRMAKPVVICYPNGVVQERNPQ